MHIKNNIYTLYGLKFNNLGEILDVIEIKKILELNKEENNQNYNLAEEILKNEEKFIGHVFYRINSLMKEITLLIIFRKKQRILDSDMSDGEKKLRKMLSDLILSDDFKKYEDHQFNTYGVPRLTEDGLKFLVIKKQENKKKF